MSKTRSKVRHIDAPARRSPRQTRTCFAVCTRTRTSRMPRCPALGMEVKGREPRESLIRAVALSGGSRSIPAAVRRREQANVAADGGHPASQAPSVPLSFGVPENIPIDALIGVWQLNPIEFLRANPCGAQ